MAAIYAGEDIIDLPPLIGKDWGGFIKKTEAEKITKRLPVSRARSETGYSESKYGLSGKGRELLELAAQRYNVDARQTAWYLYLYGQAMADHYDAAGNQAMAMTYLAEALTLANDYLLLAPTVEVKDIVAEIREQLFRYLQWTAKIDAVIAERQEEIQRVLSIGQAFVSPNLAPLFKRMQEIVSAIAEFQEVPTNSDRANLGARILTKLEELKPGLTVFPKEGQVIAGLITCWQAALQQATLRSLEMASSPTQPPTTLSLEATVLRLIREVEQQLRRLIESRYRQQFGNRWLERIAKQHPGMYAAWLEKQQRDQAAFRLYSNYVTAILDYSRLEDLVELINAQWSIFRETFDFGSGKENKRILAEKIQDIVKVRNRLAHYRSIPDNELLRAQVYCNDLLLALQRDREKTTLATAGAAERGEKE